MTGKLKVNNYIGFKLVFHAFTRVMLKTEGKGMALYMMIMSLPALSHSIGVWTFPLIFVCQSQTIWASSRQNLPSGVPTKRDSTQSPQLQRLAREMKFHL